MLIINQSAYPVMGQLQGNLDEGIGTCAALLNQTFAKVVEGENVRVHVVGQSPGQCQRALDDLLALEEVTEKHVRLSRCSMDILTEQNNKDISN